MNQLQCTSWQESLEGIWWRSSSNSLFISLSIALPPSLSLSLSVFFQHVCFKLYPGKMRTVGDIFIYIYGYMQMKRFCSNVLCILRYQSLRRLTYSITIPRGPHTPPIAYNLAQTLSCKNVFGLYENFLCGGQLYRTWWTLNLLTLIDMQQHLELSLLLTRGPNVKVYYCTRGECVGLLAKHVGFGKHVIQATQTHHNSGLGGNRHLC